MFPLKDDNPTQTKPIVTIALIAICVCIFLYQFSLLHSENTFIINSFGMKPKELFLNPGLANYSTIFSSMFLHGGFMHLIGNMLFLWIYGNNIEDAMGHTKFLLFELSLKGPARCLQMLKKVFMA